MLGQAIKGQDRLLGTPRKALRHIQPASTGLTLLARSYTVFYWLTIAGLLARLA